MINKLAGILLLSAISFSAISQTAQTGETKKTYARPDIPGIFTLELGGNRALNAPSEFNLGLWGSRTFNVYYQYEFRILKSNFSFVPGIGLSLERFKLRDEDVLNYHKDKRQYNTPILNRDSVLIYRPSQHLIPSLRKSMFVTNYVDVPLELRYTVNPDDPNRSFKVSIGGRVGYLFDSFSKIKYKENGEMKVLKDKQNLNTTRFRYGAMFKVGFGNFSFFGYYNLSPLFKNNKGLYQDGKYFNEMNTFTAGISLSSF
jgi:hypothetical protein